jgi:hypothetical protein
MWEMYKDLICCCRWSGPGAKAPVALQPLGLLYTLFSTSSHCRRQISPRPTRRERFKQREVELQWARKSCREFCLNADFHVTFRDLLHAANLLLYFPSEGRCAVDFFALKNPTALAGFQPAHLCTRSQNASPRTPKPLKDLVWLSQRWQVTVVLTF